MRGLIGAGLVLLMLAFGIGVYHTAGLLGASGTRMHKPNEITAPPLPGTMYVVQEGAIFRFQHGTFRQITSQAGWMQPAIAPISNEFVAVRRSVNFSDLYLLTAGGRQVAQLTHNSADTAVESNHWSFYPRFSPDGASLFYDYDPKNSFNSYQVDLAIFASPPDPSSRVSVQWTYPNAYTGGDVNPVPLREGGFLYTRYSIDEAFHVHSQVWIQERPGSAGQALTALELDCAQPALSPDEKRIAMVCGKGSNQSADLDVATFDPATLTAGAPMTLAGGRLLASPAFSPDGKTIAYLSPSRPGGHFQLWTVASAGPASSVRDITTDLGLDPTSAPVWVGG